MNPTPLLAAVLLPALLVPTLSAPFDFAGDGSRLDPAAPVLSGTAPARWAQRAAYDFLGPADAGRWRAAAFLLAGMAVCLFAAALEARGLAPSAVLALSALALWNPLSASAWLDPLTPGMLALPLAAGALAAPGRVSAHALAAGAVALCPAFAGSLLASRRPGWVGPAWLAGGLALGEPLPVAFGAALWAASLATVSGTFGRFAPALTVMLVCLFAGLTVAAQDARAARSRGLAEVLTWARDEAGPGATVAWAADPAEGAQFAAHLRRVGRGDLAVAPYTDSHAPDSPGAPRYRVRAGSEPAGPGWSPRHRAGSRERLTGRAAEWTVDERSDADAASAAWLRAELGRHLPTWNTPEDLPTWPSPSTPRPRSTD